jgi:hypothetical protein
MSENTALGFKVDPTRGEMVTRVSEEWRSRPDDQRFTSISELLTFVRARKENSAASVISAQDIHLTTTDEDHYTLALELPGHAEPIELNNWSFSQLCKAASAPAEYLASLDPAIAALALQFGLFNLEDKPIQALVSDVSGAVLRAVTSEKYGRIWDADLVSEVYKIAGDGVGDTRWKVPGQIDWATSIYNPHVDVTKETTTLFASDRDVFLFLVDDTNPIEAGKLPNGDPDLYFRGFYVSNSEVGSKALRYASFFLRGVCQNRCLWGVEDFQEISIRHNKHANARFAAQVAPQLESYADSSPKHFIDAVAASRGVVVAKSAEDRTAFLQKEQFSLAQSEKIIETATREEGHPPRSIFDFVQGITALARGIPHQDKRLALEQRAQKLMEKYRK